MNCRTERREMAIELLIGLSVLISQLKRRKHCMSVCGIQGSFVVTKGGLDLYLTKREEALSFNPVSRFLKPAKKQGIVLSWAFSLTGFCLVVMWDQ